LPEAQKHQPEIVRVDMGDDHGLTIGRCGEARLPLVTGHPKRSNRTTPAAIEIDYEQLWNRALRLDAGVEKLASRDVLASKATRESAKVQTGFSSLVARFN